MLVECIKWYIHIYAFLFDVDNIAMWDMSWLPNEFMKSKTKRNHKMLFASMNTVFGVWCARYRPKCSGNRSIKHIHSKKTIECAMWLLRYWLIYCRCIALYITIKYIQKKLCLDFRIHLPRNLWIEIYRQPKIDSQTSGKKNRRIDISYAQCRRKII